MSRTVGLGLALISLAAGILLLTVPFTNIGRRSPPVEVQSVTRPDPSAAGPVQPAAEWLTEYTLTERSGRPFHSTELAGKVQVVNFFFSVCPVACPLQTEQVRKLTREFSDPDLRFVSITCDPEIDTPAVLKQYAEQKQAETARWFFLTGDLKYIRRVGAEVYFAAVDYRTHVESLLVIDRWGKLRGAFAWNKPERIRELKELLPQLLAETQPPAPADQVVAAPDEQPGDSSAETSRTESGAESEGTHAAGGSVPSTKDE